MTTYVNTPSSEIFGRFKGPKNNHFFTFHSQSRGRGVASRLPTSMVVLHQMPSSINWCLQLKVVLNQRSVFIKCCLPSKIVFPWRSSSIECCLPLKVVFNQRVSSIKGCLPSKVIFHPSLSSIKVVSHQRSSSIIVVFHQPCNGQFQACNILAQGGIIIVMIIRVISVPNWTGTELANWNWA